MPLLGSSSGSSEHSYRGNLDDFPNQFTLDSITNLEPGQSGIATATISGINYQAIVTATNSALVSIDGGPYSTATLSSPRYIKNNQTVSVKFDTTVGDVSDFSKVYSTTLNVGRVRVNWSVTTRAYDDTPNTVTFVNATNLPLGIVTNSNTVTITGLEPGFATLSSITSGIGSFSINGGTPVTTGSIANGDSVFIQQRTSNNYSTTNTTTLRIGSRTFNYSASTRAANLVVNGFSFTNLTNVAINADQESNTITISGPDPGVNLPVSISAPGQVRINNSPYISGSTNCVAGDSITVRIPATALSNYGSTVTTTLTVSGFTTTFSATVRPTPVKTIPNQFDFTNLANVDPLTVIVSDEIRLSGMTTGNSGTASISGGNGEFRVRRNGTTVRNFSSAPTSVFNGDDITLRLTSANENQNIQTTFTVSGTDTTTNLNGTPGQVSDIWSVVSRAANCQLPLSLLTNTFTDISNVEVNTEQVRTFVVSGISSVCDNILTTSSDASVIVKNGVESGGSTSIAPGDSISVVLVSAPTYGTQRSTTITSRRLSGADAVSTIWRVSTIAEDVTPDPLNVSAQNITQAEANILYTIQAGSISGLTAATRVSATITSTNGTARISKNSTALSNFFTTLTDIRNDDVIFVSMTSNPNYGSFNEVATLTIGGLTEQWTISNAAVPFPTVQLSINPNPISINGSTNINWSSTNATSVVSSNFGATALSGSTTINNITQQTEYNITVQNQRGQATGRATVFINNPPAPTVTLTTSKTTVFQGETFTVTWNSTNATRVTFSDFNAQSVSGSTVTGPFTLSPGVTSTVITLNIRVENSVGQTATASVNVTVLNQVPTLTLTPSGAITVPFNGSFSLNWSATNATQMSATFPIGQNEFRGSRTFSNITSSTEYIITATNPSGEDSRLLIVNVATPPPTVTLTASPTNVEYNQNSTLSWILTNATRYTSNFGAGANNGNNGSLTIVGITSTRTYTLTASNSTGSASSSVTVTAPSCSISASINDDDSSLAQCKLKSGFITFLNGNTASGSYYLSSLIPNQRFTSSYLNTTGIANQLVVRRAFSFGVLHRIIYNAFISTLNLPPTNAQIQYYTDLFLRSGNSYILPEDLVDFINQNNTLIAQQNASNGGVSTFNDFCLNPWFTTAPTPTIPSCTFDGQLYLGDFTISDTTNNYRYTPGYVIFNNKTDNTVNDLGGSESYYRSTINPALPIPNRSNFTYGQVHTIIRDTYVQELKTLPTINNINTYTSSFSFGGYATLQDMRNAIISNVASTKATWTTFGGAKGIVNVCGLTIYK